MAHNRTGLQNTHVSSLFLPFPEWKSQWWAPVLPIGKKSSTWKYIYMYIYTYMYIYIYIASKWFSKIICVYTDICVCLYMFSINGKIVLYQCWFLHFNLLSNGSGISLHVYIYYMCVYNTQTQINVMKYKSWGNLIMEDMGILCANPASFPHLEQRCSVLAEHETQLSK